MSVSLPPSDSDRRVRVLAVTSELPWPLDSGGHIRSFHLLKALSATTSLHLVCPLRPPQQEGAKKLRDMGFNLLALPVGPRTKLGEIRRLFGAMLSREPYVMYRRHAWRSLDAAWDHEVRGFAPDVLYLDHLDSFRYRRLAPRVPAVLDLHNVYSLLVRRTAEAQPGFPRKAFLRREAQLLARIERCAVRDCTAVTAVSRQEADYFQAIGANAVHVIPNGVDCSALADLPTGRTPGPPTVLFLGTMSWGPNAAAARFLATAVMPLLREHFPEAQLLVVGRDPPAELQALSGANGVEVTGVVLDVKPYLRRASIMAVPLDAGGGTRLKILEAFAAGLPVVSTAIGAEGIDAIPGRHLIVAERPEFAAALEKVLARPDLGTRLASDARSLAREVYDWGRIGRAAAEVVREAGARG